MHDIWNPWHGCVKCSEGCQNCYMYYLDAQRDKDGGEIYRTKAGFRYPLSKTRSGEYKVKSGDDKIRYHHSIGCGRWDLFAAMEIGDFRFRSALRVRACRKPTSLQNRPLDAFAVARSSPL